MINDFGLDLEELESRLYSQVYHTRSDNYENETVYPSKYEKFSRLSRQNMRYFQTETLTKQHSMNNNFVSFNNKESKNAISASNFLNEAETDMNNVSQVPINNNQIPQVVHMVNPCNNIFVLPQIISRHDCVLPKSKINSNFERYINRQAQMHKKKQRKLERMKQKQKQKKQLLKERKRIEHLYSLNEDQKNQDFTIHHLTPNNITAEINQQNTIIISDSDDSCVEIPQNNELVIINSDESDAEERKQKNTEKVEIKHFFQGSAQSNKIETENKANEKSSINISITNSDHDVLLIEDVPEDLETIEIDCDLKSVLNINENKINSDKSVETCSINSEMAKLNVPLKKNKIVTSTERKELLKTPDSTSNDFLDNTLDLKQKKFNFSLHGFDFSTGQNFLKPKPHVDIYETESSCSASDISTPIKNAVFHEIEFETPNRELFGESNLETFGNYITPSRNSKSDSFPTNNKFEQITTKASTKLEQSSTSLCSNSSSESDYDGNEKKYLSSEKKKMPNLTSADTKDKSSKSNRNLNGSFSNKRKKNTLENSILRKKNKNTVNNVSQSNKLDISKKDFQNTETIDNDTTNKNININFNEPFTIKNNVPEVYYISDDDSHIHDISALATDIELVNCKSLVQVSQRFCGSKKLMGFTKYWTTDMHKFYNTSWGLENFSIEEMQKTMSDNPKLWTIIDKDYSHNRLGAPKGPRCHKCREFGHISPNCPNYMRPAVCSLCGQTGHLEPRCPTSCCTLCGSQGGFGTYCSKCANWRYIQCKICYMYGHIDEKCPDLWRRYHLTTQPGPIIKPLKPHFKPSQERWCSGCAKSGHYEYKCRFYTRSHHSVNPYVKDYTDIYNCEEEQPSPLENAKEYEKSDINSIEIAGGSYTNAELINTNSSDKLKNIHFSFENFIFPPIEMIPPYFRKQMTSEECMDIKRIPNNKDYKIENCITMKRITTNNIAPKNLLLTDNFNKYSSTNSLNAKLFAYAHSTKGIHFINEIRRQPDISVIINKNNGNEDSPAGTITVHGDIKHVEAIDEQLKEFFKSAPKLQNIPKFSKPAYNFFLPKLEKIDKIVGNCKALYHSLENLKLQLEFGLDNYQIRKRMKEVKLHLNMLLFGKLRLGDGQKHMDVLQYWQKQFEERDNYKIPLNTLYDIFDSYSYIFVDVNHDYKFFCGIQSNGNHLSSNRTSFRDRRSVYKYGKLVEAKCRKLNMFDKLQEMNDFKSFVIRSNYSTKAYKEFMKFCHSFLHSVKTVNLY